MIKQILFIFIVCILSLVVVSSVSSAFSISNLIPFKKRFAPQTSIESWGELSTKEVIVEQHEGLLMILDNHSSSAIELYYDGNISTRNLSLIQQNKKDLKKSIHPRIYAEAIFGIFTLPSGVFLALITNSIPAEAMAFGVREIKEVDLILIPGSKSGEPVVNVTSSIRHEKDLHLLRKAFARHSFYFSSGSFDVTRNTQSNFLLPSTNLWESSANEHFFWNSKLVRPFIEANLSRWVVPITNAWVSTRNLTINGTNLSITLVSRRSRSRQGPRYLKRGIDEQGYVANFVETEQIIRIENRSLMSFVQLRGSIPLFWSQPEVWQLRPDIILAEGSSKSNISVSSENNQAALRIHLEDLVARYGPTDSSVIAERGGCKNDVSSIPQVVLVNLIDKHGAQGRLGRLLANQIAGLSTTQKDVCNGSSTIESHNDWEDRKVMTVEDHWISTSPARKKEWPLRFIWFDYHKKSKKSAQALRELYHPVSGIFNSTCSYFALDTVSQEMVQQQSAVVRTNCIDCLDRTNIVQTTIGRWALLRQLSDAGVIEISLDDATSLNLPDKEADRLFRQLWGDNGDSMSELYAGTRALKRDVTRHGRRTQKGALDDGINSMLRYYINNFKDRRRQRGVDLILGLADSDKPVAESCPRTDTSEQVVVESENGSDTDEAALLQSEPTIVDSEYLCQPSGELRVSQEVDLLMTDFWEHLGLDATVLSAVKGRGESDTPLHPENVVTKPPSSDATRFSSMKPSTTSQTNSPRARSGDDSPQPKPRSRENFINDETIESSDETAAAASLSVSRDKPTWFRYIKKVLKSVLKWLIN